MASPDCALPRFGQTMSTEVWYRKFRLEQRLDELLAFSKAQMDNCPCHTNSDHKLLDKNSRYWDWPTRELQAPCVQSLLSYLEQRHQLPVNTLKTRIALWEYGKGDSLPPHTDVNISLSATIVVSLVGAFETRVHDEKNNDKIIGRVVYGPGDYIVLNNTVVRHSGEPLSDYRLALVVFVDPDHDMVDFWKD